MMWTPLCMDAAELRLWSEANTRANSTNIAMAPCDDCPTGFALEMRAIGRCNGIPRGHEDDDEPAKIAARRRNDSPEARVSLRLAAVRMRAAKGGPR